MAKFKVGDKVRASEEGLIQYPQYLKEGEIYTIAQTDDDDTVTVREFEKWFCESRFEPLISADDRIADLENQIETWKRLQKTNEATIRFWQEKHEQNQQCLILFAKRLNKVTAENVELKRKIAEEVRENQFDKEFDEAKAIFEAMLSE